MFDCIILSKSFSPLLEDLIHNIWTKNCVWWNLSHHVLNRHTMWESLVKILKTKHFKHEFYLFYTRPISVLWTMFVRFWWHLDLETLGMPPKGTPRAGEAFLSKNQCRFFAFFCINPIFNLFLGPPFAVFSPI